MSGRHADPGSALVEDLRGFGAEAAFVRTDVRHEDDIRGLVDDVVARYGRLDIAINNAGTVPPLACASMPWHMAQLRRPCSTALAAHLRSAPAFYASVPLKRGGTPEEIAEAILFVAAVSYVTGQIIRVNGGKTAS